MGLVRDGGQIEQDFPSFPGLPDVWGRLSSIGCTISSSTTTVLGSFWFLLSSQLVVISLTDLPARETSPRLSDSLSDPENVSAETTDVRTASTEKTEQPFHNYPLYSPRFWHGMPPLTWLRLLRSGGFRIHLSRLHHVFGSSWRPPATRCWPWCKRRFLGVNSPTPNCTAPPCLSSATGGAEPRCCTN